LSLQETDFVIIGAGSAGCVLANRLSEHSKVTLIEAGPADHQWDFRLHMPAALSMVLANDRYNWFYHSEPEPGLNNRKTYCPRGRVLGGSSSINGMVYIRGNPGDFEQWAGNPGLENWRYEDCLPFFKKAETCSHGDSQFRGRDGPIHIRRADADNPLFKAWLKAGPQAGFLSTEDINGEQQEGFGVFDQTIRSGKRFSAAQGYLQPISNRGNLSILKKSHVTRIVIENHLAAGVEFLSSGQLQTIRARREVILCGGAINSPQLLMLSGIGDGATLTGLGIPVISDLPGVGQNLQDHLEIYVQYECRQPVSIYPAVKWYNKPLIGLQWYLTNSGPGATNHFEAGAFLRSNDRAAYPDLQFHFLPVAMDYDGKQKFEGHGFQAHVGPMKPTSRGSVTLQSRDPTMPPRILFNYNTTPEDQDVMRKGIRLVREIISQGAFNPYRGKEIRPGPECSTDKALNEFICQKSESAYHPSCSCKMGEDNLAVVDTTARVHGVDSLRVVDASVFPAITNGNLNAPVIMLAEKISDAILGDHS